MKKQIGILLGVICSGSLGISFSSCAPKTEKCSTVYELNVEYLPETNTLMGTEKLIYENCGEGEIDALKFNLFPNAFREGATYAPVSPGTAASAYYDGKSYGKMQITSVEGGISYKIAGEDENILEVSLENPLFPDESITLDVGFLTTLAKVNHRTGITEKTVNLGNFYPILCAYTEQEGFQECVYYSDGDPFLSDCADYTVRLTAPAGYTVASSGKLQSVSTLETKKEYTMSLNNARDFAIVLSDHFKTETCQWQDTEMTYYYYDDETPAAHLAAARESFDFYQKSFGEYPYSTYSIVQTGFCYGGMEYPALVYISDALNESDYVYTIVHETAHQWWYAAVGSDPIHNAWQDEGLAEYSAALFFDTSSAYGFTREKLCAAALKEYRSFYDIYSRVFGTADTSMKRHLKDFISDFEYKSIAYDKGMLMFDALKTSIGEKRFYKGLRNYYSACLFKIATPEDMVGAFEKTGVEVSGFFDSYLDGKVIL